MGLIADIIGTLRSTFRVGKATLDSSGLSAARSFTLPNSAGTVELVGHSQAATTVTVTSSGAVTDIVTVQDALAHAWSAGALVGMALTDNGNGTINVSAGEAMLRTSADEHATLVSIAVSAVTNLSLTDGVLNYVVVNYNAGTPAIQVVTALTGFNCLNICLVYTIAREGTTLYWVDARNQNVDPNRKHRRMLLECDPFRHVKGGCALGASGTRNISITAGAFYYGLAKISHAAFDTSGSDTFKYYYRDGAGGWSTQTAQTQINNTQYDDGSGTLATLSSGRYGIHWVYLILDNPTIVAVQFGQSNYSSLANTTAATVPAAPPSIQGVGVLIGRIIIQKNDAAFTSIDSAFLQSFVASAATTHNGLAGLQGGVAGEYYHLTAAQSTVVGNTSGTNTGDNSANTTYANDYRAANFVAGTNYLAPSGSGSALTFGTGTLALGGNLTFSGAYTCTVTLTGNTSITFPVSGTLAALSQAQTFSAAQRGAFSTLTDGATVTADLSLANQFYLTLGGNRTLGVPTNIVAGQQGVIKVRQDSTGTRTLAYAWCFDWIGGTAGTLSTPGCSLDQLVYSVDVYSASAVTITIATPGVVSWTAHGLENGQKVQFTTTGALPTGLTASTTYFVAGKTANDFKLSSSLVNAAAGTYIATSGSQSGTHTLTATSIALAINKAWA